MQNYVPLDVMNLEVFILGGQRINQKKRKGWWRRERFKKGAEREKRQNEI